MYNPRNFCITVFWRVFYSTLKLELCRHACRHRDPIILTCRYGKNMPTTPLEITHDVNVNPMSKNDEVLLFGLNLGLSHDVCEPMA